MAVMVVMIPITVGRESARGSVEGTATDMAPWSDSHGDQGLGV
jgi:hypothetical protein